MRIARGLLFAAGALVAALVAAVLVVTLLVDPNRFRDDIERAAQRATGRAVSLEGDIDLSFLPWLALRAGSGSIGNPPGFEGPILARWAEAYVGVPLAPLLRGELVVERVQFVGLDLQLVTATDGRDNFTFAAASPSAAGGDDPRAPLVRALELRESRIAWIDARDGSRYAIEDVSLDVEPLALDAPMTIDAAFSVPGLPRAGVHAEIEAGGRVAFGPPVVAEALEVSVSWPVGRTGDRRAGGDRVATTSLQVPSLTADLDAGQIDLPSFVASVADARVSGRIAGRFSAPRALEARIEARQIPLRRTLDALGITAPPTTDPAALERLDLSSELRVTDAEVVADPLRVVLDETTLTGRVNRSAAPPSIIEFDLRGDRIALARYLGPEDAGGEPFEFPAATLKALGARGVLVLGEVTLGDTAMRDVRIEVRDDR